MQASADGHNVFWSPPNGVIPNHGNLQQETPQSTFSAASDIHTLKEPTHADCVVGDNDADGAERVPSGPQEKKMTPRYVQCGCELKITSATQGLCQIVKVWYRESCHVQLHAKLLNRQLRYVVVAYITHRCDMQTHCLMHMYSLSLHCIMHCAA